MQNVLSKHFRRPPRPVLIALGLVAALAAAVGFMYYWRVVYYLDNRGVPALLLYGAAAVRLLIAPLIPLVLLLPLHLPAMSYCACVVLCAVPPAGATAMFAQKLGRDTALAAQTVSAVTLMSMLTLPVFAVAARQLSGLG